MQKNHVCKCIKNEMDLRVLQILQLFEFPDQKLKVEGGIGVGKGKIDDTDDASAIPFLSVTQGVGVFSEGVYILGVGIFFQYLFNKQLIVHKQMPPLEIF